MRVLIETSLPESDLREQLPATCSLDATSRVPMGDTSIWSVDTDGNAETLRRDLEGVSGVVAVWAASPMVSFDW